MSAPKVALADVEASIATEHYFTAMDGVMGNQLTMLPSYPPLEKLTFCVLVLKNGFTVTGESACVSADNFDFRIGKENARKRALDKVWELLAFTLSSAVAEGGAA